MVTREQIDKYLWKNYRKLPGCEFMFGVDNNQNPVSRFETAKMRVLVAFLSTGAVRSVSNTYNALDTLIHDLTGDDVFVDYCYLPELEAQEAFKRDGIPFIFGNLSHAPAQDYDILCVSHAIMPEILNLPHILSNSGIPLNYEDRQKDNSIPLIMYGGASSSVATVVFGDTGLGGHALADIGEFGFGEDMLNIVMKELLDYKNAGNDIKDKHNTFEYLKTQSARKDFLYFAGVYEYETDPNDALRITKIIKKDDRCPDKVGIHTLKDGNFPGFPNKIFNLNGDASDSHDVMLSIGCSGGACCSFKVSEGTRVITPEGLVPIEELAGKDGVLVESLIGTTRAQSVKEQEPAEKWVVTNSDRGQISVDENHIFMVLTDELKLVEKTTKELCVGDKVLLRRGHSQNQVIPVFVKSLNTVMTDELATLMGFVVGDGCVNDNRSNKKRVQIYFDDEELMYFKPIIEKYLPGGFYRKVYEGNKSLTEWSSHAHHEVFEELGLCKKGFDKEIPEWVFRGTDEIIRGFVRGLWQADGYSAPYRLSVTTTSEKIARGLQQLLLYMGYSANFTIYQPKASDGYERRVKYEVFIKGPYDRNRFLDKVGLICKTPYYYEGQKSANVTTLPVTNKLAESLRRFQVGDRKQKDIYRRYRHILRTMEMSEEYVSVLDIAGLDVSDYKALRLGDFVVTKIAKIENTHEVVRMFDVVNTEDHLCVYDMWLTHQCYEGTTAGGWREKSFDKILEQIQAIKRNCAPNTLGFYSYNLNYYYRFLDLLKAGAENFSNISLINERMDVIAARGDYMQLAKALGLMRVSAAVEGLSERIRNKVFNKNLTNEQLFQGVRNIFAIKPTMLKMGMIISGRETKEDYDEWFHTLERICEIRDEMGTNTGLQISNTPLVHYQQTPIGWMERITARNSLYGKKNQQYYIEGSKFVANGGSADEFIAKYGPLYDNGNIRGVQGDDGDDEEEKFEH